MVSHTFRNKAVIKFSVLFYLDMLKATANDRERQIIPRVLCRAPPNLNLISSQVSSFFFQEVDRDYFDIGNPLSIFSRMKTIEFFNHRLCGFFLQYHCSYTNKALILVLRIITLLLKDLECNNNNHEIKIKHNKNTTRHKIYMKNPKLGKNHVAIETISLIWKRICIIRPYRLTSSLNL